MHRKIEIAVDQASWPGGIVPPKIKGLPRSYGMDVLEALLHTALWTRPPVFKGFALGDFWAWLRYIPAIGVGPDLRLRPEWTDIDSHQKTVFSDEVAVGAVTCLLADRVGCIDFVETKHALRALGSKFSLTPSKKKGPDKSPDYIARLPNGRFLILECKGTQTSRKALDYALDKGKAQKQNLVANLHTRIYASIVAGLFIPQFEAKESALLKIMDPEWSDVARILEGEPEERVAMAVTQVACAKALSLGGYLGAANTLALRQVGQLGADGTEFRIALGTDSRESSVSWTYEGPNGEWSRADVTCDASVLAQRLRDTELSKAIRELTEESGARKWEPRRSQNTASLITPLGLRLSVAITGDVSPVGQSSSELGS